MNYTRVKLNIFFKHDSASHLLIRSIENIFEKFLEAYFSIMKAYGCTTSKHKPFESWYTLNLNCLTARFEVEGIFREVSNYLLPVIVESLRDFKMDIRYFT